MDYKKKYKREQIAFLALSFLGFLCIGGSVGYFLIAVQDRLEERMSTLMFVAMVVAAILLVISAYFFNICLHETGHMLFGLMTGYEFRSLRFGNLMLVKENGRLRFCRFSMPVVLYNLGGLIMNLAILLLGAGLFLPLRTSHPVMAAISLVFAVTALSILITNGLPFMQTGTDGANAIILHKDKNAREVFRKQMEIIKYFAENYSLQEMPVDLFSFDQDMPMTNPLITAQAFNHFNYLDSTGQYAEAKEMASFILTNAQSMNPLHEAVLHGELLFIAAVIERDFKAAGEIFRAQKKTLTNAAGFLSIQRVLYAYYSLVDADEKKAAKMAKQFEKGIKTYPYPKDALIEQAQFDLVEAVIREHAAEEAFPG